MLTVPSCREYTNSTSVFSLHLKAMHTLDVLSRLTISLHSRASFYLLLVPYAFLIFFILFL